MHWPNGFEARGEIPTQLSHLIDVAATVLDAAGIPEPAFVSGPQLIHGDSQLLFGGMGRLTENTVINIKNKSHSVTAEVEIPASGAQGVIVTQGGETGGWSLYAHDGKLKYCYNLVGMQRFYAEGATCCRRQTSGAHGICL